MFATIQDLYMRFGRENVLSAANLDGLDATDPVNLSAIEERLVYFLGQAYDQLISAIRQGSYNPNDFSSPYPQTLVNANCEIAFIQLYRTRHTEDETVPDAYKTIEENNFRLIRDIQGSAVRFDTNIPRAMSMPTVTRSSLPGFAATPQKVRPPARVNGILPDINGNIVIDEPIKSTVFDSYVNAPYLAVAGKTYIDVDTGRWGFCYVGTNGVNRFLSITGGGSGGTGDYRDLSYKPMINGVVVNGEQTGADLGLADAAAVEGKANKILLENPEGSSSFKDLVDVENELFSEIQTRTSEDTRIQNAATAALQAYRTAAQQDTVDTGKVTKQSFTDTTTNPNGFVLLWLQPNFSANAVRIDYAATKPLTGEFIADGVALPFADSTQAGLMTLEQATALSQAVNDIANLQTTGGFKEYWFDTRAQLAALDVSTTPPTVGSPAVVWNDEVQGGATTKWQYAPDDTSGRLKLNGFIYGGIAQEVPYTAATSTTLGLILSTDIDGGMVVEPTGVAKLKGYDAIITRLQALETWKAQQQNFNTTHNHTGGAQGVVLQKQFTVYANDAAAIADTSHNQALSPMNSGE